MSELKARANLTLARVIIRQLKGLIAGVEDWIRAHESAQALK